MTERDQLEVNLIDRMLETENLQTRLDTMADREEHLESQVRLWRGERDRLLALIRRSTHRTRQVQQLGNRLVNEPGQWTRANIVEFMNRCGVLLNEVATEWNDGIGN